MYLIIGIIIAAALFFYFLRRTDNIIEKERKEKEEKKTENLPEKTPATPQIVDHEAHEEEAAAIAMALFLYKRDLHDKESFTITMQKVSRIYSPWNSKIYTLRQIPNRR
jgi:hypothetical protein